MNLPTLVIDHHGKSLFRLMQQWRAKDQIAPVLLLTGPSGIGKRSMAHFLAQWIHCKTQGPNASPNAPLAPCGHCISCKKALAGQDLDFVEIQSDSESDGPLKIDQFRQLKTTAGFGAHENRFKIILIPSADRMTPAASNSMLKLLEEPPSSWIFLLTCSDPTLLLPTLVSRCQVLRLKPFSDAQITELLTESGVPKERIPFCTQIGQGSWKRALRFASDEIWQQRSVFFQFFSNPGSVVSDLIDWTVEDKGHFDILLDFMEHVLAELIQGSLHDFASPDLAAHVKWATRHFGGTSGARSFWFARIERVAQARQESSAPLNRKLLAQDILLPWLGARA